MKVLWCIEKIVCLSVKLFVYTTNANVYRKHPIDDVLFKAKKKFVKMNLKPHYLSCFHEFFKTRILLFLGLSTTRTSEPCSTTWCPPLFHKITTPRPHTHKKRSQMIPSSIRKNVQQNKYKFLFHVFFKKLLLSCYYSIITTHFIINTGNGITFFHHFR